MGDKKHIDRLFQEKLKDFEASPSDAVWDHIHDRLHKGKRKRRVIPIWWKLGGVAALLALMLTVGIQSIPDDQDSKKTIPIVNTDKNVNGKDASQSNSNVNQNEAPSKIANETVNPDGTSNATSNVTTTFNSEKDKEDANSLNVSTEKVSGAVSNSNRNPVVKNNPETKDGFNSASQHKNLNTNKDAVATNGTGKMEGSHQNSKGKNNSETNDRFNNTLQNGNMNTTKDAVVNNANEGTNSSKQYSVKQNKEASEVDKLIYDSRKDGKLAVTDVSKETEASKQSDEAFARTQDKKEPIKNEISIEDAIAEANSEEDKEENENKLNRWNISPNVAPVYFNTLGKGSTLDAQFVDNANQTEVTMSYGIAGSYALNDRIKIRAGINKVNMGYNTNNVIAFKGIQPSGSARSSIQNVSLSTEAQSLTYISAEGLNSKKSPEIINAISDGALNQRFGFIEVPLELEYALTRTKLGVNIIGGFSTLIVDKNEIYSVIDGHETQIGEANNINSMSYSANLGFGFNYHVSDRIKVNLEPTFKYQLHTFSDSAGEFQPYFIGIYTGLSYKF